VPRTHASCARPARRPTPRSWVGGISRQWPRWRTPARLAAGSAEPVASSPAVAASAVSHYGYFSCCVQHQPAPIPFGVWPTRPPEWCSDRPRARLSGSVSRLAAVL